MGQEELRRRFRFDPEEFMDTKKLLESLLKLQALEFDETELDEAGEKEMEKRIAELRILIPLAILNHYDRLRVRGKKGVAAVRHQTCVGCHVQVTRATVLNLMHGNDLQVCENCGRYLYLATEPETAADAPRKRGRTGARKAELSYAA